MPEEIDIKNLLSRVHRSADGMWHVFFRGRLVYYETGRVREFASEAAAKAHLVRCVEAGKLVD